MSRRTVLAGAGLAALAAAIGYGTVAGDGWDEVARLVSMPWGLATLVDVYVGLALFGGWIVARERSPARAAAWIVALLLLGNLVSCVYVLLAIRDAGGDSRRFWLGRAAGEPAGA